MTKFPSLDIEPKNVPVTAVMFDGSRDWEWVLRLAEWCGGTAFRDEQPGQQHKSYYWSIVIEDPYWLKVTPGTVLVKYSNGEFAAVSAPEFESNYRYRNGLGTFPCYLSMTDGHFHRAKSSYSDFADFSRCSTEARMVSINRDVQFHSNSVSMFALCLECFGCTAC